MVRPKREYSDELIAEALRLSQQKPKMAYKDIGKLLGVPAPKISDWNREVGNIRRRNQDEISELRSNLLLMLEARHPMTIRQVFYQAVVNFWVPKEEERGYNVVQRELTYLRDEGMLDLSWIVDGGRRIRRPYTVSGLEDELYNTAYRYRRSIWDNQEVQPVVLVEKIALAGLLEDITDPWDVPLAPLSGFSSISMINQVADFLNRSDKPGVVYYFGDWDPSGEKIPQAFERRLRDYTSVPIKFTRVAVNPSQIEEYNLPTRPTKKDDEQGKLKNMHAKNFEGDSVELDALPPEVLQELVESSIKGNIDQDAFDELKAEEAEEKALMRRLASHDTDELIAALDCLRDNM